MSWTEMIDLPVLVTERRREKRQNVRDKIQRDLEVIAERKKCKKEVEPFPDRAFERLHRDHIWDEVLKYLTDPWDITNAYFACRTFTDILEERRTLLFLPEILKILLEKQLLQNSDCFNLRRTSKSWKKVIDRQIFEADFLDPLWYTRIEIHPLWGQHTDAIRISDRRSLDLALTNLSAIKEKGQESFHLRKLHVIPQWNLDLDWLCDKVLEEILEHFGDYIWCFVFDKGFQATNGLSHDCHRHLLRMLEKLPNLRALGLRRVTNCELPDELEYLEEAMKRHPFPMIPTLEHLLYEDENEHFINQIYALCTGLKSVSVRGIYGQWEPTNALNRLPLERLEIEDYIYELPPSLTCNLKVLDIRFRSATCSRLWPALNRFQGTLESLTMRVGGNAIQKDDHRVQLRLPHLKSLNFLFFDSGTIGFDDLLHLNALEKLEVQYMECSEDRNALVKVYGIRKQMHRSNIWECFPHLRELKFRNEITYLRCGSTILRGVRNVTNAVFRWTSHEICVAPNVIEMKAP